MRMLYGSRSITQVFDMADTCVDLEWNKNFEFAYQNEFPPFLTEKQAFQLADKWTRQAKKVGWLNASSSLQYHKIGETDTHWYLIARQRGAIGPTTILIRRQVSYLLALRALQGKAIKVYWEFEYISEGSGLRMENA